VLIPKLLTLRNLVGLRPANNQMLTGPCWRVQNVNFGSPSVRRTSPGRHLRTGEHWSMSGFEDA